LVPLIQSTYTRNTIFFSFFIFHIVNYFFEKSQNHGRRSRSPKTNLTNRKRFNFSANSKFIRKKNSKILLERQS